MYLFGGDWDITKSCDHFLKVIQCELMACCKLFVSPNELVPLIDSLPWNVFRQSILFFKFLCRIKLDECNYFNS